MKSSFWNELDAMLLKVHMINLMVRLDDQIALDEKNSIKCGLQLLEGVFNGLEYQVITLDDKTRFTLLCGLKENYNTKQYKGFGSQIDVSSFSNLLSHEHFIY